MTEETEEGTERPELLIEKFNVAGIEYTSNLANDIRIDRMNLSEEFADHSRRFAWYSTAYELSVDHETRLKALVDRAYAQLDTLIRANAEANGIKLTEKRVENAVITHHEYVDIQDQLFDAKLQTGLLKSARDAMMHRKDALVSIGANQRAELSSDPSLLADMYRKNK